MTIELNQYSLIEQTFASGGVNLKSAVTALQDNETPYCRNVTFGSIYGVESRQGFSKKIQTPTGATITGLYQLQRSNNTEYNIFASGANIYLRTSYTAYASIIAGRTPGPRPGRAARQPGGAPTLRRCASAVPGGRRGAASCDREPCRGRSATPGPGQSGWRRSG